MDNRTIHLSSPTARPPGTAGQRLARHRTKIAYGLRSIAALIVFLRLVVPGPAEAAVGYLPADPLRTIATRSAGQDFPDPSILLVGDVYYAYATNAEGRNIPVMRSTDLRNWSTPVDALPVLPAWARTGRTWAPSVVATDGTYRLYYAPTDAAAGRQCISTATADSPLGPFHDTSTAPLVCQLDRAGSIDPYAFTDSTGSYLVWKSEDNALHRPTNIWARRLDPTTGGFVPGSVTVRLLTRTAAWQAPSLEGPAMTVHDGIHYLFYGANDWATADSGIGYATCLTALGPCVDRSTFGPWMTGAPGGRAPLGPQGPTVFVDATGTTRLAFAAWTGTAGYRTHGRRSLWTAPLNYEQLHGRVSPALIGLGPDLTFRR
jgi:beta-xylosidase